MSPLSSASRNVRDIAECAHRLTHLVCGRPSGKSVRRRRACHEAGAKAVLRHSAAFALSAHIGQRHGGMLCPVPAEVAAASVTAATWAVGPEEEGGHYTLLAARYGGLGNSLPRFVLVS